METVIEQETVNPTEHEYTPEELAQMERERQERLMIVRLIDPNRVKKDALAILANLRSAIQDGERIDDTTYNKFMDVNDLYFDAVEYQKNEKEEAEKAKAAEAEAKAKAEAEAKAKAEAEAKAAKADKTKTE